MKKYIAIAFALVFCFLTPFSVQATEYTINNDTGLPQSLDAYSEEYIRFTLELNNLGIVPVTCIEDFVAGFENDTTRTINEYVNSLIEWEVEISKYQKSQSAAFMSADMQCDDSLYQEFLTASDTEVLRAYERVINANRSNGIELYLPYVTFEETFESSSYDSVQEYADALIDRSASVYRSGGAKWYDNLGATFTNLPTAAQYDKYNLLATVKKGDIIQETQGGAYLTGHVALSLGKYYDASYNQYYIRTVEANTNGVVYGALDDTRVDDRGVNIFYVTGATNTQINAAANFALSQLGKPYNLAAILLQQGYCSNTNGALWWYCSELVWAAYYNQGLNLNGSTVPINIYLPSELADSALLSVRYFR